VASIARGSVLSDAARRLKCGGPHSYLACRIYDEAMQWQTHAQFRCNTTQPEKLPRMNPAYKQLVDETYEEDCASPNVRRKIPYGVTTANTPLFARLRMTGYVPDIVYVNSPKLYRSLPKADALEGKYVGTAPRGGGW
jgi:hypothetical protein